MIIFRSKQLSYLAFFAVLFGSCSDQSVVDPTINSELSEEEHKYCDEVTEREKAEKTGNDPEQSVPDYNASDITNSDKDQSGSSPDAEYYKQREADIQGQEVDQRLRQLEQNAEVRKAEENARRAREEYNSVWEDVPGIEIEPYEAK